MANVKTVKKIAYVIELNESEASGLFALLFVGVVSRKVDELGLRSLLFNLEQIDPALSTDKAIFDCVAK